jgi:hypothetical protein
LPEIATVLAGLALRVPEYPDPSDIDTEVAATVVPAAASSARDAVVGLNVIPVGVGVASALTVKVAEPLKRVFMPFARTRTG